MYKCTKAFNLKNPAPVQALSFTSFLNELKGIYESSIISTFSFSNFVKEDSEGGSFSIMKMSRFVNCKIEDRCCEFLLSLIERP